MRLHPKLSIAIKEAHIASDWEHFEVASETEHCHGGGRRILETGRILRLRPKLSIAMGEAHIASDWEHFEVASETEHCHWVIEKFLRVPPPEIEQCHS